MGKNAAESLRFEHDEFFDGEDFALFIFNGVEVCTTREEVEVFAKFGVFRCESEPARPYGVAEYVEDFDLVVAGGQASEVEGDFAEGGIGFDGDASVGGQGFGIGECPVEDQSNGFAHGVEIDGSDFTGLARSKKPQAVDVYGV